MQKQIQLQEQAETKNGPSRNNVELCSQIQKQMQIQTHKQIQIQRAKRWSMLNTAVQWLSIQILLMLMHTTVQRSEK